ncbi:aKG-HExxH-type peptide beta-hydroxylase [Microbacterium paraoxydans]|uniref:aKG-HExxH-type peptide beta-hydroxylase n=1 Tax=Microbacterium paraoxydans TaxID=199592 RepID=UPI0030139337
MSASVAISAEQERIAHVVRSAETVLTSGVFGVGAHISATADAYYRGVGRMCAEVLGVAPEILESPSTPGAESLRRAQLDRALRAVFAGDLDVARQDIDDYLDLRPESRGGDIRGGDVLRLAEDWGTPGASAGALDRFAASTLLDSEPVSLQPAEHSAELAASISDAVRVAEGALPTLARDAFSCVSRVGVFTTKSTLYSGYASSAALFVFINETALQESASAAEFLLHESLHQKLNDISLARTLVRHDYRDEESDQVHVPWSFGSDKERSFGADRSFAAFHVYTHQVLLYLGMYANGVPDEIRATERAALAWARADVFARAIRDGQLDRELGRDGRRLADWLGRAVDQLGEVPLPGGRKLASFRGEVHG